MKNKVRFVETTSKFQTSKKLPQQQLMKLQVPKEIPAVLGLKKLKSTLKSTFKNRSTLMMPRIVHNFKPCTYL